MTSDMVTNTLTLCWSTDHTYMLFLKWDKCSDYFILFPTAPHTQTHTHVCLVRNTAILNEKRWGKHSGLCIANVHTMALQCVCAYRCMFANPFVFKLFPYFRVHLVVALLIQSHTGRFPLQGRWEGPGSRRRSS